VSEKIIVVDCCPTKPGIEAGVEEWRILGWLVTENAAVRRKL